ncbi:alpha/beta fold hydrolase [Microbacterium sp.]|uniref:alpha/beta fold hydrolase n=1 Tax=Microbacterium sp. TaxID=51671 RepID=UPI002FE38D1D
MSVQVVLVHGIRTSATMWRSQVEHLEAHGYDCTAVDLPGHGTRMHEDFTLDAALHAIDDAVRAAAERGPVLLVGHSMGGLLSIAYTGGAAAPPVAGLLAAACTSLPRGAGLSAYRMLFRAVKSLPGSGMWITRGILTTTVPRETRADFGAGGYALDVQDRALASLAELDIPAALRRISVPLWFVNGQYDQLRVNERLFQRLAPHAELVIVPRTTHLVTVMRPRIFNAAIRLGVATIESDAGSAAGGLPRARGERAAEH